MKISKIIDDVKDDIDEVKLKVVDVVDKAELEKRAKEFGDATVDAAQNLAKIIEEGKRQWDLNRLKPIFLHDLNGMCYSRLIRIVERDKKFDIDVMQRQVTYFDKV